MKKSLVITVLAFQFSQIATNLFAQTNFQFTYSTQTDLSSIADAIAGDFDGDGINGFLAITGTPNARVVMYEEVANNYFMETTSLQYTGSGVVTIDTGDTDGDGQLEVVMGHIGSTFTKISLFENTGNNTFAEQVINISEPGQTNLSKITKVMLADLDKDGQGEIIFGQAASSGSFGGKIFIYEQTGGTGINQYQKVYTYTTPIDQDVNQFAIGDPDNDGNMEVVVIMSDHRINRIENTGDNTYQFKSNSSQINTQHSLREVAIGDTDGDGSDELIFGFSASSASGVAVYKSFGNDSFSLVNTINTYSTQVSNLSIHEVTGSNGVIAVGTFNAEADLLMLQNGQYTSILNSTISINANITSVNVGFIDADNKLDFMISTASELRVYEDTANFAVSTVENSIKNLSLYPNPAKNFITVGGIENDTEISIHTIYGQNVYRDILSENNRVDISFLSKGIYVLNLLSGKQSYHIKFVKE